MDQCIINFEAFNWLAVLVAAVVGYALGALWYSVLFGKSWMEVQGFKEEDLKDGWQKAMIITFITTFLTAFVLEAVITSWGVGGITEWSRAIPITFLFGVFLYGGNQLSEYLYSRRPMKLFWITFGYRFVMIFVMTLILILWR